MRTLAWMVVGGVLAGGCGEVKAGDSADATPGVDSALDERCEPGATGPGDEDSDGAIDEGCPWSFGKPHVLASFAGEAGITTDVDPAWISPDGLRLYLVVRSRGVHQVRVVTRPAVSQPFGAAMPVAGVDLGNYVVNGITLSADEREAYLTARPTSAQGGHDVYVTTRTALDAPFAALALVPALSTAGDDERPFLRADGRELLVSSDRVLRRSLRSAASDAFASVDELTGLPADDNSGGYLSRDGRTLFFYRRAEGVPHRILRASRSDAAQAHFTADVELTELEPERLHDIFYPVLSEPTREIFFGSSQPWTPTHYAVWRAEVCRTPDCSTPAIPCAGVTSEDGQHCYTRLEQPTNRAAAQVQCESQGGTLATIHSQAEHDRIWSTFRKGPDGMDQLLWIGGFDDRPGVIAECNTRGVDSAAWPCPWAWETGEPWTWSSWATTEAAGSEPNESLDTTVEEDCLVLWTGETGTGKWNDIRCTYDLRAVCETTAFPAW